MNLHLFLCILYISYGFQSQVIPLVLVYIWINQSFVNDYTTITDYEIEYCEDDK